MYTYLGYFLCFSMWFELPSYVLVYAPSLVNEIVSFYSLKYKNWEIITLVEIGRSGAHFCSPTRLGSVGFYTSSPVFMELVRQLGEEISCNDAPLLM